MKPDPEKDILGENLRRALGACDKQVDRSYAEFLRRMETDAAPPAPAAPRRPVLGLVTLAASLLVCAGVLAVILSSGGSSVGPSEAGVAAGLQDKKKPSEAPPPSAQEESLAAQIALQEKILGRTTDEKERALVAATILTLRAQLARVREGGATKGDKKGGPSPILDELNGRLKEKPDDPDLLLARGEELLRLKKWTEALADGRKAAELAPDRAAAHFLVARASHLLKQTNEADKAFARALELDPKLAGPYQEFRTPPPPKGKPDPAADRAAKLRAELDGVYGKIKVSKDADEKAALEMRVRELGQELKLLEQGSRKEVNIKAVEMKLQENPDDVAALVERGRWHFENGKADPALKDFDRALRLKPDHAPAHLARGMAHALAGNPDAATQDVKRGAELEPTAKKEIEYAWATLKKLGQSQKEPSKTPKDVEQQLAALKDRLEELRAMEANADLSETDRGRAKKEADRVQLEIEKLKVDLRPRK